MLSKRDEILVGLMVSAIAALILWWIIPVHVDIPRRVPIKALSPAFWPNVIGLIMLVCGVALTLRAALAPPTPDAIADDLSVSRPEAVRLLTLGALLVGAFFSLRIIGMVWICMIVFVALIWLTDSKNRLWGIAVGVVLPLALYFFFTKVAGVAIPQGQIVRLP